LFRNILNQNFKTSLTQRIIGPDFVPEKFEPEDQNIFSFFPMICILRPSLMRTRGWQKGWFFGWWQPHFLPPSRKNTHYGSKKGGKSVAPPFFSRKNKKCGCHPFCKKEGGKLETARYNKSLSYTTPKNSTLQKQKTPQWTIFWIGWWQKGWQKCHPFCHPFFATILPHKRWPKQF